MMHSVRPPAMARHRATHWLGATLVALSVCAGSVPSIRILAATLEPTAWTRYHSTSSSNALVTQSGVPPVSWRSPSLKEQVYAVSVVGNRVYGDGVGKPSAVFALDRGSGKLLWRTTVDNWAMSQPLVVGTRLFVGTGDQTYFYRNGIQYFGTGSNSIYALDTATGKVIWRLPLQGEAMPTPVYQNGVLYWVTGDRSFLAIDASTGRISWQLALPSFMSMSSPAQDGNLLIFGGARTYNAFAVDNKGRRVAWQYKWTTWKGLPITNGVDDCPPA